MDGNHELNQLVAEVGAAIVADAAEASREEDIELVSFVCAHLLWVLADRADSGDEEAAEQFANITAEIDRALEEVRREEGGGHDG